MISPNADEIVGTVKQPLVHGWPERTAAELFELAVAKLDGKAAVIALPEDFRR